LSVSLTLPDIYFEEFRLALECAGGIFVYKGSDRLFQHLVEVVPVRQLACWSLAGLAFLAVPGLAQAQNPYVQYHNHYSYGWWWSGYYDPVGSYLEGAAAVTREQGKNLIRKQQALKIHEEVLQEKVKTRRAQLEQWLWELDNVPNSEDLRERYRKLQVQRASIAPPDTEIQSAKSLNDLLTNCRLIQHKGIDAPSDPLPGDLLQHINVTSHRGNIGLLRQKNLFVPILLRRPEFDDDRNMLVKLSQEAVQEALVKKASSYDACMEIQRTVDRLNEKLVKMVRSQNYAEAMTPYMYVDAKQFLRQLEDAVTVLQQKDALYFLNGTYAAKGNTVADLVKYMVEKGLNFAPSNGGDETQYRSLFASLSKYNNALEAISYTPGQKR
jgi:hypothetical protein